MSEELLEVTEVGQMDFTPSSLVIDRWLITALGKPQAYANKVVLLHGSTAWFCKPVAVTHNLAG